MPRLPLLKQIPLKRSVTDKFLGYRRAEKIGRGEFYHTENLCSDFYPLMASRNKRGVLSSLSNPLGMVGKSSLLWLDDRKLYVNGEETAELPISLGEKQLVSMGAYLIIFPDKYYVNCERPEDRGYMESFFESHGPVSFSLCSGEGEELGEIEVSVSQPESPQNGQYWIDSSHSPHSLKRYSAANEMWVSIETVYVRLGCPGMGADFRENDAVEISGCEGSEELLSLNGSHIIESRGQDYILIQAMLSNFVQQTEGSVKITRKIPDMDFVIEAENRLWGCKYGMVEGKAVNEIYACALGDFRNWNRFQGLADDSYRASLGSDGPFTAAVTHMGYPIFFKENCLHKVYISANGGHRIADSACEGVQLGSHKSLALLGDSLFYLGNRGICLYEGSLPRCISQNLGDVKYHRGVGGSLGDKYYISMLSSDDKAHLFVYDSRLKLFHREDSLKALCFARFGGELYCIDEDSKKLIAITGSKGDKEKDFHWQADSGLLTYSQSEQKYLGRIIFRLSLPVGAYADVFIDYDSQGVFHHAAHVEGSGTGSFSLPVRPRRCDHFRLRLTGYGSVRLYSTVLVIESGSDY